VKLIRKLHHGHAWHAFCSDCHLIWPTVKAAVQRMRVVHIPAALRLVSVQARRQPVAQDSEPTQKRNGIDLRQNVRCDMLNCLNVTSGCATLSRKYRP
jgi:hypothetical protein